MHPVLLQVSFPASAELAYHFYVSLLFYKIQYDLQNLLLFFQQAFAELLHPFSKWCFYSFSSNNCGCYTF